ncbi:hypothetical protein E2562_003794 [Oryza meyeriana var. granulata]|uniref:Uncharacterized protein n=1 Tax=Oryza meyeriana var. granulata TaxID=110450 RepID=A0A6G1BS65_9ORYZ|nr:hypothetical protein E2562_003794 [Oryza meyeriana var. granulata]
MHTAINHNPSSSKNTLNNFSYHLPFLLTPNPRMHHHSNNHRIIRVAKKQLEHEGEGDQPAPIQVENRGVLHRLLRLCSCSGCLIAPATSVKTALLPVKIYASFGGLLMLLKGDPSNAASFELDLMLFLLIWK